MCQVPLCYSLVLYLGPSRWTSGLPYLILYSMSIAESPTDQAVRQSIDYYTETPAPSETMELKPNQVEMLRRQTSFLQAYVKYGNIAEAAEEARVTRPTVGVWRSKDALGFRQRFTDADDAYVDRIEGRLRELAEEGRSFQAIKAILDAKRPAVWRERSTLDTGTADLLSKLASQAVAPEGRKAGEQWSAHLMNVRATPPPVVQSID